METLVLTYPEVDYETERGKPMPSRNHAIIQNNLVGLFFMNYRKKYRFMSEISLELEDWKSVPDIAIFPSMEVNFFHDDIRLSDAPLGVIEILSPTQGMQELGDKAENYFQYGVKSVWIVIPNLHSVVIYSSAFEFQMFASGIAKDATLDIEIDLSEVFS
jgi:Uma2 family endonuclease